MSQSSYAGVSQLTETESLSSRISLPWQEAAQGIAEDDQVQPLLKPGAQITPQELFGTGFTYRHDWGNKRGQWKLPLNWGAVNPRSRVFVAIGEGAAGGPDGGKFLGAARYTVHNVAPRAGGVDIWVNIEWGSDIRIYVDYLVINP